MEDKQTQSPIMPIIIKPHKFDIKKSRNESPFKELLKDCHNKTKLLIVKYDKLILAMKKQKLNQKIVDSYLISYFKEQKLIKSNNKTIEVKTYTIKPEKVKSKTMAIKDLNNVLEDKPYSKEK